MTGASNDQSVILAVEEGGIDIVQGGTDPWLRVLGWLHRLITALMGVVRPLFQVGYQAPGRSLLPGQTARIKVMVSGPPEAEIHLYAESTALAEAPAARVESAQHVRLDHAGVANVTVSVTPADPEATGASRIRLVAVRPEAPDFIAAERDDITIVQDGTTAAITTLITFFVGIGMLVQVIWPGWPIMAAMIVIALTLILTTGQRAENPRYNPGRLLPLRRQAIALFWAVLGTGMWVGLMWVNTLNEDPVAFNCDELGGDPCPWDYVLGDNVTAIAAALAFAFCLMLAVGRTLHPRWLAGRIAIVGALVPLLVYDLTVLGYPGVEKFDGANCFSAPGTTAIYVSEGDTYVGADGVTFPVDPARFGTVRVCGQDSETARAFALIPEAEPPLRLTYSNVRLDADETLWTDLPIWQDNPLYQISKSLIVLYPMLGWGLVWFGIVIVVLRQRLGGWQVPVLSGVAGIACLGAMAFATTLTLTPSRDIAIFISLGFSTLMMMPLHFLLAWPGRWRLLRVALFLLSMFGLCVAGALAVGDMAGERGDNPVWFVPIPAVFILALVWLMAECWIVRKIRRRRPRETSGTQPDAA